MTYMTDMMSQNCHVSCPSLCSVYDQLTVRSVLKTSKVSDVCLQVITPQIAIMMKSHSIRYCVLDALMHAQENKYLH